MVRRSPSSALHLHIVSQRTPGRAEAGGAGSECDSSFIYTLPDQRKLVFFSAFVTDYTLHTTPF